MDKRAEGELGAPAALESESSGVRPALPVMVVGQRNSEDLPPFFRKVNHTCDNRLNALTAANEKDVDPGGIVCTVWYTVIVGIVSTLLAKRAL